MKSQDLSFDRRASALFTLRPRRRANFTTLFEPRERGTGGPSGDRYKRNAQISNVSRRVSSFVRPERDPKLRELIVALQKQIGEPTTGILTYGQFSKLQDAARGIDERQVAVAPGKIVYRSDNGEAVGAVGTGVMDDLANPINVSRILCTKSVATCELSTAEFDLKYSMLTAPAPTIYEIKTWTTKRVTAIREHPCGSAFLTIDLATEDVTIASTPHGFKISWNLYRDRYNKARDLVYEPARKMFPVRDPAN